MRKLRTFIRRCAAYRDLLWLGLILFLVIFTRMHVGFAAGEGSEQIVSAGTGLDGTFDTKLKELALGAIKAMQIVLLIMTAIAGMMITFGLEDGKKFLWQVMLGAGLAINFGGFLLSDTGIWAMTDQSAPLTKPPVYQPDLNADLSTTKILGSFMDHYTKNVIVPGAANILPFCLKLLIILTVVQASWELSMKFISGDKLQYLISIILKLGFFMFLMMHWMEFMQALMDGFESIGIHAAGGDGMPSDMVDSFYRPAVKFVATIFAGLTGADPETVFDGTGPTVVGAAKGVGKMISSPIITLLGVITIVIVCFCFFMAALELFMARVEVFTMALMTIPCLAFGTMSKFNFLTEKAIGCMFNCAMKVCVIAFLAISTTPFVESFMLDASKKDELSSDAGSLLQAVLASLMIYMLIKKIPALISTLLNGAPQLGGSDMIGSLKSAAGTAATVGSAVVTGGATAAGKVAAAKAAGGGTLKGTLSQLGRDFVMSRSPVQSYRSAVSNFRSSKDQTASHNLSMMKKGVTMQQEAQKGGNGGNDANGNGNGGGQGQNAQGQAAQGQNASQRKDDDN